MFDSVSESDGTFWTGPRESLEGARGERRNEKHSQMAAKRGAQKKNAGIIVISAFRLTGGAV